jgi:hypothetical protein
MTDAGTSRALREADVINSPRARKLEGCPLNRHCERNKATQASDFTPKLIVTDLGR